MRSDDWWRFRQKAFLYYGRICCQCGDTKRLEVNHLTYERLGKELLEDVNILCFVCHVMYHQVQRGKSPKGPRQRDQKHLPRRSSKKPPVEKIPRGTSLEEYNQRLEYQIREEKFWRPVLMGKADPKTFGGRKSKSVKPEKKRKGRQPRKPRPPRKPRVDMFREYP